MIQLLNKINHLILSSNNILLATHHNPDGDALGCLTAMINYLESLNKNYTAYSPGPAKKDFQFLDYCQKISHQPIRLKSKKFDLIIVIDAGDFNHAGLGDYIQHLKSRPLIINIDHHSSNHFFGDINIVQTQNSSSAEILYNFFKVNHIHINQEMATSLLLGIMTDTDRFQTSSTNSNSIYVASRLILLGANLNQIIKNIFQSRPLNNLKLLGNALEHLNFNPKHKIAYTILTEEDFSKHRTTEVFGLANLLQNIQDTKMSLILRQLPDGLIKGSLRTNQSDVDLARLAALFGGGGHRQAAGFMLKGKLVEQDGRWSIE